MRRLLRCGGAASIEQKVEGRAATERLNDEKKHPETIVTLSLSFCKKHEQTTGNHLPFQTKCRSKGRNDQYCNQNPKLIAEVHGFWGIYMFWARWHGACQNALYKGAWQLPRRPSPGLPHPQRICSFDQPHGVMDLQKPVAGSFLYWSRV